MNTDIKKGDKVDILIKGAEVTWVDEQGTGASQMGFYHSGAYQPARAHVYTGSDDIEVTVTQRHVEKPEWWPLQGGDVVLVGATEYFVTTHGDVHYLHSGNRVEDGRGLLGPFKDWLVEWAKSSFGKDWARVQLLVRRGKTYRAL